jgi:hypothetical protein
MSANKDRHPATDSKIEGVEDPHAVATITELIHKLYAVDGPSLVVRKLPDDELIDWSEVVGTVRR